MNRNLTGIPGHVMNVLGMLLTLFVLSILIYGPYVGYQLTLAIFLFVGLPMTFFMYSGGKSPFWMKINFVDWLFVIMSIISMGYLIINAEYVAKIRIEYVTEITKLEFTLGIIALICVLEATRRAMGLSMAIIALVLILYIVLGKYIPPPFGTSGFDWDWLIDTMYLTTKGIFSSPLWVVITLAFPFILYGVILEELGILRTFIDFANRVLGRTPGAPAKSAIIAGTFMGMASGLPMSTTYLIGFPTIPEMKKVGYPPMTAGAIAAVVGTAAQLMPPMLGVAAFVVAQYMNVPYVTVCQYTLLPALMFYFVFYCTIDFETRKWNIMPVDIVTKPMGKIFADGFYIFLISIIVLVFFLVQFYPVGLSALYACLTALVLAVFRKSNRWNLKTLYIVMGKTGKTAVYISIACVAAGVIIGTLVETGLNMKFANMVISIGRNSYFLALVLSALAILILSMGMPSIPAYITGIAIFGPALIELGAPKEVAHIFCFYYATLYAITPPVAFASYAGAQLAGTDPFKTGLVACKLGIMTYVIPFLFAYHPAYLLIGKYWNVWEVLRFILLYIPGLILFAAGLSGFWTKRMKLLEQLIAIAGGTLLLTPFIWLQLIGVFIFAYTFWRQDIYGTYIKKIFQKA
ncbi:MAG: TRAP transporter fused permease subunit [Syntrophales bacterium]|nr:TRAP transporter fused permease subunit [Syntrophales bacterium]